MARSSLLGIDPVQPRASGHDSEALGPSDSSDSGSDVTGLEREDALDPGLPVDVATAADFARKDTTIGEGSDSDAAGSGERRSAAGDAGLRDAADIAPDRVIGGTDDEDDDDVLAELAALDGAPDPLTAVANEDDEPDPLED